MNSLTALVSPLLSTFALLIGLVGLVGARVGWIPPLPALALFAALMPLCAALALLLGLIGLLRTRPAQRRGGASQAWAGIILAAAALVPVILLLVNLPEAPPIHDVTTNIEDPPEFVAAAPHDSRGKGFAYPSGGASVPGLQREGYPDLATVRLNVAPSEALRRAADTAEDLGWTVMLDEPETGRLEFSDRTNWFRFVDYIAVRVRPTDDGSAVDLRSVSQVGLADLGANAARIRRYVVELTGE